MRESINFRKLPVLMTSSRSTLSAVKTNYAVLRGQFVPLCSPSRSRPPLRRGKDSARAQGRHGEPTSRLPRFWRKIFSPLVFDIRLQRLHAYGSRSRRSAHIFVIVKYDSLTRFRLAAWRSLSCHIRPKGPWSEQVPSKPYLPVDNLGELDS